MILGYLVAPGRFEAAEKGFVKAHPNRRRWYYGLLASTLSARPQTGWVGVAIHIAQETWEKKANFNAVYLDECGVTMRAYFKSLPFFCLAASLSIDLVAVIVDYVFGVKVLYVVIFLWCLAMVPMAALLYWFRRAHRVWYGGFEFVVAFGAMYFLLLGMITAVKAAHLSPGTITARTLAMFAVAYFMVRALDNIGEGLKPGSVMEARWSRWFPKAK